MINAQCQSYERKMGQNPGQALTCLPPPPPSPPPARAAKDVRVKGGGKMNINKSYTAFPGRQTVLSKGIVGAAT